MANIPKQGQHLPNVEFVTEDNERLAARDLTGQKTVLYFYPKDDTPGCTKEACAFRDRMDDYRGADIRVYGVSLDSPESHRRFREKNNLNFPLLTDEDGRAAQALESRSNSQAARSSRCRSSSGMRAMACRLCTTAHRRRSNRFLRTPL